MANSRLFTRREIEGLIANGDDIVIFEGMVLRLNGWKDKHPGGGYVIQHMVGRDATDEMNISHSLENLRSMPRFRIGRVDGMWTSNFVPPIQGGIFRKLGEKTNEQDWDSGVDLSDCSSDYMIDQVEQEGIMPVRNRIHSQNLELDANTPQSPESFIASQAQNEIYADIARYPSLDNVTQQEIATKFKQLHQRVRDEGYYQCPYSEYAKEVVRYVALFALFAFCLTRGWYFASACFMGLFWHQIMFTAHDAGHRGITHDFTTDTLIAIFVADFCCGLSIGWWRSSHNVHHLVPNLPEHDPDIQNVPLFSTSAEFFSSIKSSYYGTYFPWDAFAAVSVKYQQYTYYPVMAVARFNLYFLSWLHLASVRCRTKGKTYWTWYAEVAGITAYMFLYFYVLLWRNIPTWESRIIFLVTSHLVTMPLHVQITLSHWTTSTADLGPSESFAQRQLRTTMDVSCPAWLDFVHGGLQFQAVHHLFPRVPRHNLRRLSSLVKRFCEETKIEYLVHDFVAGNGKVLGKLGHVTEQARLLAECQAFMARTGESGLH